ncbi:WD40 repeat domain-containing protein [Nocardia sp. NRRL S-836]|uniref:WD40 repeat domain-containing protein n=1 Tax=Nocardia sp. NRRL S-836 TaxID=1519492 RepID=UPI0006AED0FB|nr:hypothetical protein ADL03_27680 [Nocardia sp. NRRL S-836]
MRLWDLTDPRASRPLGTITGHTDVVTTVSFSPEKRTLATSSWDRTTRLWDVTDPAHPAELATVITHSGKPWNVRFGSGGAPSEEIARDTTAVEWPFRQDSSTGVAGVGNAHKRTILSSPAMASVVPVGLKAGSGRAVRGPVER